MGFDGNFIGFDRYLMGSHGDLMGYRLVINSEAEKGDLRKFTILQFNIAVEFMIHLVG